MNMHECGFVRLMCAPPRVGARHGTLPAQWHLDNCVAGFRSARGLSLLSLSLSLSPFLLSKRHSLVYTQSNTRNTQTPSLPHAPDPSQQPPSHSNDRGATHRVMRPSGDGLRGPSARGAVDLHGHAAHPLVLLLWVVVAMGCVVSVCNKQWYDRN